MLNAVAEWGWEGDGAKRVDRGEHHIPITATVRLTAFHVGFVFPSRLWCTFDLRFEYYARDIILYYFNTMLFKALSLLLHLNFLKFWLNFQYSM